MENYKDGIWQMAQEIQMGGVADNTGLPDTYTFIYYQDTLIIKLPSVSTSANTPPDDIYRLLVKWNGSDMFFFPPFGFQWELFAAWEDNRFVMKGTNKTRVFQKIGNNEIPEHNKDLLNAHPELWKYDRDIPATIS